MEMRLALMDSLSVKRGASTERAEGDFFPGEKRAAQRTHERIKQSTGRGMKFNIN